MTLRRLALPAVVTLGLLPGLAQALGLGEITLKSSLYEPLDAEIELLSVRDLETREILPALAGSTEFKKAGVERFFHLSKMRFSIKERPGGKKVIHVTTTDVVTEPFLNFLVEVHWPSGRLLREYTMLLDPPAFARATPAPVAPPVTRQPLPPVEAKAAPPAPKPAVRAPLTTASAPSGSAPAEKKTSTLKKSPEPATDVARDQSYGPVRSADTLWSIAKRYRPSGANMHQTMLAIQRLNPDAFINNNINLLKRGKTLRIPSAEQVKEMSRSEATAEFARQEEAWKQRKQGTRTVAREVDPAGTAAADDSGHLKLITPPPEDVAPAGSSTGGSEAGSASADTALAISKENLDKSERRTAELEGHVKQLEGQVQTLERLIELKNAQLADLQSKLDQAGQQADAAPATDTDAAADAEQPQSLEDQLAAAQAALEQAGSEMDDAAGDMLDAGSEAMAELAAPDDSAAVVSGDDAALAEPATEEGGTDAAAIDLLSEPEPEAAVVPPKPEPKPKPQPKAAAPKKVAPPPPEPEPGLFENPLVLGGIGGGALLALVGGMMFLRRRKAAEDAEDPFDAEADLDVAAPEVPPAPEPEAPVEEAAAFAAVEETVDELPLEAPEPESKPPATAVESALEEDGPSLDDLGMELTADIAGGSADSAEVTSDTSEAELAAELDSLSAELDAELDLAGDAAPEATVAEASLDDLDLGDLDEAPAADASLDDFELDLDAGTEAPAADTGTVADLDAELGDLDLGGEVEAAPETPEADLDAGLDELDLDGGAVDDLDLSSDLDELDAGTAAAPAAAPEAADDLDLGDLDLDDTAGGDEVATKMDLARAYIDMGDAEGAREILDEVVQEGNDEQKAEAEALIAKL